MKFIFLSTPPEVLGTIAGDDTVLIVVDSNEDTPVIVEKLKEYIR